MSKRFNLKQYKNSLGQFNPLIEDSYFYTKKGQTYLEKFYVLEEAFRLGRINYDEKLFLQDQITHPDLPCNLSTWFHGFFSKEQIKVAKTPAGWLPPFTNFPS